EGLVELRDRLVDADGLDVLRRSLACGRAELVDAEPAGQLAQPRPDRVVVPQLLELLVGPGEDLLEHVLGVVVGEAKRLDGDGVHVAREALDELVPSGVVAGTATSDEGGIGELRRHERPRIKAHSHPTRKRAQRARFASSAESAQTASSDWRRRETARPLIRTSVRPIAVPAPMLASCQLKPSPLTVTSSGVR